MEYYQKQIVELEKFIQQNNYTHVQIEPFGAHICEVITDNPSQDISVKVLQAVYIEKHNKDIYSGNRVSVHIAPEVPNEVERLGEDILSFCQKNNISPEKSLKAIQQFYDILVKAKDAKLDIDPVGFDNIILYYL